VPGGDGRILVAGLRLEVGAPRRVGGGHHEARFHGVVRGARREHPPQLLDAGRQRAHLAGESVVAGLSNALGGDRLRSQRRPRHAGSKHTAREPREQCDGRPRRAAVVGSWGRVAHRPTVIDAARRPTSGRTDRDPRPRREADFDAHGRAARRRRPLPSFFRAGHDGAVSTPVPPDEFLTDRLQLRPPTLDDAPAIFEHYGRDPRVPRYLPWAPHASLDDTLAWLHRLLAAREAGTRWPWTLLRRQDERLIGMIELRVAGASADFGYVLEHDSWGQGYATEAASALVAWARAQPTILRVFALCDTRNLASARVLEKSGLRAEGLQRRALPHGGAAADVLVYAWVRAASPSDEPIALALDHVQLAMPRGGEAVARAFWGGLLGLRDVPRPGEMAGRPGLWFERGPLRVHVGVEDDFRPARKAHPALLVAGYDALIARLAKAGHVARPAETLGSTRRVHVDDPFGNRVEIIDAES
jgi:RimJ/RimL family protein N-acetyltransferase